MKHGRKPTRAERDIIEKVGLDTYEWLVQKHTTDQLFLINKDNVVKCINDINLI